MSMTIKGILRQSQITLPSVANVTLVLLPFNVCMPLGNVASY